MKSFQELGLKKEVIGALSKLNISMPDKLQEKVLLLKGKNVIFTSKARNTLAYTLGYLGKINTKRNIQMLVVVPAKESCVEVAKDLKEICAILNINVGLLYDGRNIIGDYRTIMKKNQIIIGTPNRLIKHINNKKIHVGEVGRLVFDECHLTFELGYDDCVYIKSRVSSTAQVLLSSLVLSDKVIQFMEDEDYELVE